MGTDGLKVLVVDDEARMRKLVRDFLTVKGFYVLEAENEMCIRDRSRGGTRKLYEGNGASSCRNHICIQKNKNKDHRPHTGWNRNFFSRAGKLDFRL